MNVVPEEGKMESILLDHLEAAGKVNRFGIFGPATAEPGNVFPSSDYVNCRTRQLFVEPQFAIINYN